MKFKVLLILIIFSVFISCKKDELGTNAFNNEILLNTSIPSFKTLEEFIIAANKTSKMTNDEIVNYENALGYNSFGRICDEFYHSINPDNFKSKGEIEAFVSNNNKFLVFDTDYTGDTYCLPREYDNKARYLINEDKMYIIGDFAFKRFEKAIVSTEVLNISSLYKLETAGEAQSNPIFNVQKIIKETSGSKKEQYEDHNDKWANGDYYRIKLFIQTELFHWTVPGKVQTDRETEYKITNFKRSLGIWFQKTLRTDFEIDLISTDAISNIDQILTAQGSSVNEAVLSESIKFKQSDVLTWVYEPYFYYYYAYAKNAAGCTKSFVKY